MLRPGDIPVAFRLLFEPAEKYESIAEHVGVSVSSAHRSVRRLEAAGLLIPDTRQVNRHALFRFAAFGAPFAFFTRPGDRIVRGIPTAHAAFELSSEFAPEKPVVWPTEAGTVEGAPVEPLYEGAAQIRDRDPRIYRALALLDAMRVSGAGNRQKAAGLLRDLIIKS